MNALKIYLSLLLGVMLTVGCAQKEDDSDSSINEVDASLEAGLTTLQGVLDDQNGSSFALRSEQKPVEYVAQFLSRAILPQAYAASCTRAVLEACASGVRSTTFNNCTLPSGLRTLDGWVTLSYSQINCALSGLGDSVTRTHDFTLSGVYGGQLSVSSGSHQDYRGVTISGGERLSVSAGGWDVEVLGKHKVLNFRGRRVFDVSTRTLSPIGVSGNLSRNGRVIDGGSFEVNHNRAHFTATYQPHNLTYSSQCCHPVSGTLDVSYTGSVTGSATVTFNGCGSYTLNRSGLNSQIDLNYCE